jgi:hypothetical protein
VATGRAVRGEEVGVVGASSGHDRRTSCTHVIYGRKYEVADYPQPPRLHIHHSTSYHSN